MTQLPQHVIFLLVLTFHSDDTFTLCFCAHDYDKPLEGFPPHNGNIFMQRGTKERPKTGRKNLEKEEMTVRNIPRIIFSVSKARFSSNLLCLHVLLRETGRAMRALMVNNFTMLFRFASYFL
jgi:hypothetical protein